MNLEINDDPAYAICVYPDSNNTHTKSVWPSLSKVLVDQYQKQIKTSDLLNLANVLELRRRLV